MVSHLEYNLKNHCSKNLKTYTAVLCGEATYYNLEAADSMFFRNVIIQTNTVYLNIQFL
jgi:hypothetical protein